MVPKYQCSKWICGLGGYIQTQFWHFNLAQTKDKMELSSFLFMSMFVPTDMLTRLYNFSN